MCRQYRPVNIPYLHSRSRDPLRVRRWLFGAALFALLPAVASLAPRHGQLSAESAGRSGAGVKARTLPWHDSLGDGFPDGARLDSAQDRANFVSWFTFLAEAQYYIPSSNAQQEIQDCAALIRFAYRNSLMAHTPGWRADHNLPYDSGFGDITKFNYPYGPLGRDLFRTEAPSAGLDQSDFAEFADSATLLRYNTFAVSRDLRAARPGDLLFFRQPVEREPFHTMMFVGKSNFQPQASDWIVYHTGDINGHLGEVREVQATILLEHPDPHWRPLASNPNFLGVYRLEILR
jgi:uncharacterized protein YfaT (DUF1175 family)